VPTVFEWARDALGVTINEMFGQTEMNYIVGNSHLLWPAKPGSMVDRIRDIESP
jgi:acetyl-CoA synthetase